MVRSCFGKIKDVKLAAAQQCVNIFSRTKRPRHIDRTGVALGRLSRRHRSQWFSREEVLQTVLKMYKKSGDPKAIGALIKPYVEDSLPALAHAGYIAIDERGKKLRIRKRAARMMNDIYQEIQAADFKTALEEYFAHCDLFRQQIGNASDKSKKELIAEIIALLEANARLKEELAAALWSSGVHSDTETEPTDVPPQFSDDDIEMGGAPLAGPSAPFQNSTINATPLPRKMLADPEAAYPSPVSPDRPQGSFRNSASPPPSPSPLSRQPTLQYQNDSGMDVDDEKENAEIPVAPVEDSQIGDWGFGKYIIRSIASVLSSSVGSRKYPGVDHQALGEELRQKTIIESDTQHKLVTSVNGYQHSLETANVTITTQKEQLRHKDALLATAAENLNMERSRREKAEADIAELQEQYQVALRANETLRAESVIIKNKLFHSELGRKALLARVAKLEKNMRKMDLEHDEELQSWAAKIRDLRHQISADESKTQAYAEDRKRCEDKLQREVNSHLQRLQKCQAALRRFYSVTDETRHLASEDEVHV